MFTKRLSQGIFLKEKKKRLKIILNRDRWLKEVFQYIGNWLKIKE